MHTSFVARIRARVQQMPGLGRHEAIGVKEVLFQPETLKGTVEVANPIAAHPLPQDQVLRLDWGTDWISLHAAQPL